MTTTVYFVRHAQPNLTIHDDLSRPLTKKGKKSCKKLTLYFANKEINVAYSSPFKRAIDTIMPILEVKKLPYIPVNDFRERKIGDEWISDFQDYCKRQWKDFDYKLANGESLRETQERNIKALSKILKSNTNKNIIIGSHGTAIGTILKYFDSNFNYADFAKIQPVMPFIAKVSFENGGFLKYKLILDFN